MFCCRDTEYPRKTSSWFSPYATVPTSSARPQRVTIMRASFVACSMSEAAPEVTFSRPNTNSSATRPPIMMASREVICSRLMESLSRSGSCMTMPSARAGDDRGLMDRVGRLDVEGNDCMAALVIGCEHLFLFGHDEGFALGAHHHLVLGVFELDLRHHALVTSRRHQGCLVDEIHEVGAGEPGRAPGYRLEVHVGRERNLAHMHLEDGLAAHDVGVRHHDLAIEPAGPQQCWVEHVGTIGRGDQDDALVRLEAVHLHQQ